MDGENDVMKLNVAKIAVNTNLDTNLEITATSINAIPHQLNQQRILNKNFTEEDVEEKVLKPIKDLYPLGSNWSEIAEIISNVFQFTIINSNNIYYFCLFKICFQFIKLEQNN